MTCIVGLVEDGTIYLGGDSAVSTANGLMIKSFPKVYKRGEFLIGGAGRMVISQIMSHVATIPPVYEDQDNFDYIVNTFMPCFRDAVKEVGQMREVEGKEHTENEFILGFRGHLYIIGTDLSVLEPLDGYCSIGSGSVHALGSLYTTESRDGDELSIVSGDVVIRGIEWHPEVRIRLALEAAAKYDEYVSPPFEVISMDYEGNFLDDIISRANRELEADD